MKKSEAVCRTCLKFHQPKSLPHNCYCLLGPEWAKITFPDNHYCASGIWRVIRVTTSTGLPGGPPAGPMHEILLKKWYELED